MKLDTFLFHHITPFLQAVKLEERMPWWGMWTSWWWAHQATQELCGKDIWCLMPVLKVVSIKLEKQHVTKIKGERKWSIIIYAHLKTRKINLIMQTLANMYWTNIELFHTKNILVHLLYSMYNDMWNTVNDPIVYRSKNISMSLPMQTRQLPSLFLQWDM